MRGNMPLIIAVAGGALAFFLWKQREARAIVAQPQQLQRESVPAEWIEMTPEGYNVIGTTGERWDILT